MGTFPRETVLTKLPVNFDVNRAAEGPIGLWYEHAIQQYRNAYA